MELSNYIPHKPKSTKFIAVIVIELEIPEFRARTVFFVMFTLCVCWGGGFPAGSVVNNLPASAGVQETGVRSLGGEDLEEEMTTCSSILALKIP